MAILYLGLANPDFERDYYISPLLAPATLLAQFPCLLMTCGEKDPFVDDTVIFAGRVREAKRALKVELELAAAGKSARFGEGLRMSALGSSDASRARLSHETEEDWVQLEIFEGWSHGYLLMPSLMPEAREAIVRIGEWIDGAFGRYGRRIPPSIQKPGDIKVRPQLISPTSPKRASGSKKQKPDLGSALLSSETETDVEGLTMQSKKKRSPPPSFGSGMTMRPTVSSEETLVGTGFAVPVTGKPKGKVLDEAELIRRRRAEAAI